MQLVLLAAGKGARLRPQTYHVPKPMLRINNKNLIEHKLDILPTEIKEIIIVVGYLGEQIINHFGNEYQGKKIIYIKQKKLLGSGYALNLCKDILKDRFIVMNSDDIYCQEDIKKCLQFDNSILSQETNGKFIGGRIKLNKNRNLQEIVEGVHNTSKSLANLGMYVLTKKFFKYQMVPIKGGKEFGLPQQVVSLAQDFPVNIVKAKFWLPINSHDQLKRAEKILLK